MTAALEGGEWSAARLGRTLPPGKTQYPFYRRLDGPQSRCGRAENLVPTGIRSRTVQSVVSRYTDWASCSRIYICLYSTQLYINAYIIIHMYIMYIYSTYLYINTYVSIHIGYQFWPLLSLPFNCHANFKNCRKLYRMCKFNFLLEIILNIFQSGIYLYTSTHQLHWRRKRRIYEILFCFCQPLSQFGNIRFW